MSVSVFEELMVKINELQEISETDLSQLRTFSAGSAREAF
jgi:hypothetical protein